MDGSRPCDVGVMFRCALPPERLAAAVQQAEAGGFDEFWVVEDCFFEGGISSAASALASSRSIRIGLGIMPAVARNPAFAAMEIATLARLHPGRFLPGLGHGMADWMRQIGAFPHSQLAALEETTQVVRALLHGKRVTFHGQHVHLDDVQLVFPPDVVPPIALGVRGPKSLALSGRSADGTILAEGTSTGYIRWARARIAEGQQAAGRTGHHRLTVLVTASVDADSRRARDKLRLDLAGMIASGAYRQQLEPLGILPAADVLLAEHGELTSFAAAMPDEWIAQLAVAGSPAECQRAIRALAEAGADSVVLVPVAGEDGAQIALLAAEVLPGLAR